MTDGKKPDDWQFQGGAQLDPSGEVVGRPQPELSQPPTAAPRRDDEPLELVERAPKPSSDEPYEAPVYREDRDAWRLKQRRQRLLILVGVVFGLGVVTLVAFAVFPTLQRELPTMPAAERGALLITSEPSGAEIRIGEKVIGTTPYAGDNLFGGTATLELRKKGYQPFTTTFAGGGNVTIDARLKK